MSVISNVHTLVALKDAKALTNQRLARLVAKKNKSGEYESPNLTESLGVSVPLIENEEIAEHIQALIPHIRTMLENAQDGLIREFRIEHGRNEIPQEEISVEKCITYLEESARGSRVTKEYLQAWFTETYSEAAAQFIRLALAQASDEVVAQKTAVIRDMFAGFSSGKYSPEIPKCKAMVRFVAFVGEEADSRLAAYGERAARIQAEKEAELSTDALGF